MSLSPKLLSVDNPGSSHFEQSMSEVILSMEARNSRTYAQAITGLISIINIGLHSEQSFIISQQMASVLCESAPSRFTMEKIEADVNMLFRIQNAEILRNRNEPPRT